MKYNIARQMRPGEYPSPHVLTRGETRINKAKCHLASSFITCSQCLQMSISGMRPRGHFSRFYEISDDDTLQGLARTARLGPFSDSVGGKPQSLESLNGIKA